MKWEGKFLVSGEAPVGHAHFLVRIISFCLRKIFGPLFVMFEFDFYLKKTFFFNKKS